MGWAKRNPSRNGKIARKNPPGRGKGFKNPEYKYFPGRGEKFFKAPHPYRASPTKKKVFFLKNFLKFPPPFYRKRKHFPFGREPKTLFFLRRRTFF